MAEAKIIKTGLKGSWKAFVGALHVSPPRLLAMGAVAVAGDPLTIVSC